MLCCYCCILLIAITLICVGHGCVIGLFDIDINCGIVRPYNYYVFQEATINLSMSLVTDLIFVMTDLTVRMLYTVDLVV